MAKANPIPWQNRMIGEGEESPEQLLANPANWRGHPKHQQDVLTDVLSTVGWVQKVIVNKRTGFCVDGHLRIALAITHNQPTIPVTYVDLDDAEEALVLATFDPISALAFTDAQKLDELLRDVQTDSAAVQQMLSELATDAGLYADTPTGDAPEAQVDKAEELQQKWQVKRGDLWVIPAKSGKGEHRLLCGDSTSADDVSRVMDGEKADLLLTDPPYGVKMDKGFSGADGFNGSGKAISRRQYADAWDSERPDRDTLLIAVESARLAIIFGGNFFADLLPQSTHWIVWDKLNTMPTYGDCELAWTNIERKSVKKFTFEYNGLIGKEKERFHPTQKPVGLFQCIIPEYTEEKALVLDTYCGSGTTIVASEQTGRLCRAIEIEPRYVAVTLQRLADMGLEPRLES